MLPGIYIQAWAPIVVRPQVDSISFSFPLTRILSSSPPLRRRSQIHYQPLHTRSFTTTHRIAAMAQDALTKCVSPLFFSSLRDPFSWVLFYLVQKAINCFPAQKEVQAQHRRRNPRHRSRHMAIPPRRGRKGRRGSSTRRIPPH